MYGEPGGGTGVELSIATLSPAASNGGDLPDEGKDFLYSAREEK
jgi:hypothetical protein